MLAAADVDTIGALGMRAAVALADTAVGFHQVTALDMNTATVALTDASITTASFAAGAINAAAIAADAIGSSELAATAVTEIQTGLATAAEVAAITLATKTVVKSLGSRTTDGSTSGISILDAIDAAVTVTGTWDSATATVECCEDPKADVPVWTAYDDGAGPNPLSANGTVTVTGPHNAVRVTVSNDGAATHLAVSVAIRKPYGA